jgi:hypothetical protein
MREGSDRDVCRALGWEAADRDCCSEQVGQSAVAAAAGTAHAAVGGVVGSHSYWVAEDAPGLEVREELEEGMSVEVHLGRGGRYVGS